MKSSRRASTSLSRCWRAGLRRAERSSRALRNLLECWVQPSLSNPSTSVRTGCSNTSTPRLRRRSASRGSVCHRQWMRDLTICRSGVPTRGKHPESSVPPKVFEAVRCHFGVPNPLDLALGEIASFDCQAYDVWCAFPGCRFHADKPCLRVSYCIGYTSLLHSQI